MQVIANSLACLVVFTSRPVPPVPSVPNWHTLHEATRHPFQPAVSRDPESSCESKDKDLMFEAALAEFQERYPVAVAKYRELLREFPETKERDRALRNLFEIANYWLDDTREEMRAKQDGPFWRGWLARLHGFIPLDDSKPRFDSEGQALAILDEIQRLDPKSPWADKALFYSATVHFYRAREQKADECYAEILRTHEHSAFYLKSMRMAILCKLLLAGPEANPRRLREAKRLIEQYRRLQPDSEDATKFCDIQTAMIREMEASR